MPAKVIAVARLALTGPAGENLDSNPTITITERRFLDDYREDPVNYTEEPLYRQRVDSPPSFRARRGQVCYDVVYYRVDVRCGNAVIKWQKYRDFEVTGVRFRKYEDWLNTIGSGEISLKGSFPPSATGTSTVDVTDVFPRKIAEDDDIANRELGTGVAEREVGSGWVRLKAEFQQDGTEVLRKGTPFPVNENEHPCADGELATEPPSNTSCASVVAVDIDTGEELAGGTVETVGLNIGPVTKNSALTGYWSDIGRELKFTHQPPPGYRVVKNSRGEQPVSKMNVVIKDNPEIYTFFDKRILSLKSMLWGEREDQRR